MAKLDAYSFNRDTVAYIYSYLKNRKQCVGINGNQIYFGDIISGVPQRSMLCPISYNLFLNDFCYFILLATAHNIADDKTLACFSKAIQELIRSLESECEVVLNWFNENKIIVNPGKFQDIIDDNRKQDHTSEIFKFGSNLHLK